MPARYTGILYYCLFPSFKLSFRNKKCSFVFYAISKQTEKKPSIQLIKLIFLL